MQVSALDVFLLAIASVVLPVWSAIAGRVYAGSGKYRGGRLRRYLVITIRGAVLSPLVLTVWVRAGRPFSALGLDTPVGFAGRVGFATDIIIIGYYLAVVQFRKRSEDQLNSTRQRLQRLKTYEMLPQTSGEYAAYAMVAIIGSTFEELLYRGI